MDYNRRHTIKRTAVCLLACLYSLFAAFADIKVTLRSGQSISGTVLFENDEAIVIKDADGTRYQYLKTEIERIEQETAVPLETASPVAESKKVTAILQVAAGATLMPGMQWGSRVAGDLRVGACNLLGKNIFLGGGIGYHAYLLKEQNLGFIPLRLCADIPFLQSRHAPYAGIALGYGFATNKATQGGIYAGLDIGWRYAVSAKTTLLLSLNADFQQCTLDITETIEQTPYKRTTTQGFCTIGAKIAFSF